MIPRLSRTSSRLLAQTGVHHGPRLTFSSSAASYEEPYGHFCKNIAPSFREPSPRKWLGGDVVRMVSEKLVDMHSLLTKPFPLNPSFKPPVPLSDGLRTRLYKAHSIDPELNSVRALASRHNISIKRVDAILRLKGMEKAWKKVPPASPNAFR